MNMTAAVIPAHNEAKTIAEVVEACIGQVDQVILVDDGSDDGTLQCLEGIADEITVDCLRRHHCGGKAAALADGFARALELNCELVVTLDGDGQHDPKDITRLLEAARVYPNHLILGARLRQRHRQPGIRRFANRFADFFVSWASAQRVPDSQTGFRVYPSQLVSKVRPSTERRHGFVFETAMLIDGARAGFPCAAVVIDSVYRHDARASYFRPGKDVWEIFCLVAWRILRRGFHLPGLWQTIKQPAKIHQSVSS